MKLKEFVNYLWTKYPFANKEPWDPTGYSFKPNQNYNLKGVIVAIDVTSEVVEKAIKTGSNFILTHHPFLFERDLVTESIKAPYKMDLIKKIIEHRITVFSMHTNYDNHPQGTSFQIAKTLGLDTNVEPADSNYTCVVQKSVSVNQLKELIQRNLGFSEFRTNVSKDDLDKEFKNLAILSGSGYIGQINELSQNGIELIVSSDFKWSDWVNYRESKVNVLEIPHLDEEVFVEDIYQQINADFPELSIEKVELTVPFYNL
ncbi:Nif3-like dinuclear metal center hexameric protein [Mycoplasma sp. Ms02]|uniref:Nif3-like dinuclear metal center hexameric protein n=1 Tax=Mycoplasma sp. Ms02 TaxID=353851 RepID=UPI001C8A6930|nr:Nif3-like dinuclear metal center hexameric protein [Mycoplasma sp. Ms02]QZE12299.1 Nif3-like dinuclear metal center hexameric protein [Mycoplasma sp. Ms02]